MAIVCLPTSELLLNYVKLKQKIMSVLEDKIGWWSQVAAMDRESNANRAAKESGQSYYTSPNSGKTVKTR